MMEENSLRVRNLKRSRFVSARRCRAPGSHLRSHGGGQLCTGQGRVWGLCSSPVKRGRYRHLPPGAAERGRGEAGELASAAQRSLLVVARVLPLALFTGPAVDLTLQSGPFLENYQIQQKTSGLGREPQGSRRQP